VMLGYLGAGVFSMENRVLDELADMVAVHPVEHLGALPPGLDQASHPQPSQVLRDPGRGLPRRCHQLSHGQFCVEETPEQPYPRRVGQHPEDLDRQVHLVFRR